MQQRRVASTLTGLNKSQSPIKASKLPDVSITLPLCCRLCSAMILLDASPCWHHVNSTSQQRHLPLTSLYRYAPCTHACELASTGVCMYVQVLDNMTECAMAPCLRVSNISTTNPLRPQCHNQLHMPYTTDIPPVTLNVDDAQCRNRSAQPPDLMRKTTNNRQHRLALISSWLL
jgi:hypothetical protein